MRRFIGSKAFYKSVLILLIPMIIQQFITSFVSLLDNLMVGSLGDEAIAATHIPNQVMMVFNLAIFGGLSGASIFGAQFFGKGDMEGMRQTFRGKMLFAVVCSVSAVLIYLSFGDGFIASFLKGESNSGDPAVAMEKASHYLRIMLPGLPAFAVVQVYAGTLREAGETRVPMVASICAILTNLAGNWILIFGKLGLDPMGVEGAAVATVVSRYVELLIVVIYAHLHTDRYPFLYGAYRSLYVSRMLVRRIVKTATPLLINEILWSLGMTFISQSYSLKGMDAMEALGISGTIWNLFCVIMFAMGSAVSIMVGQRLGAGKMEEARDVDRKLIFLTEVLHVIIGLVMILTASLIPQLYAVDESVKKLTSRLLVIAGLSLPIHSFAHVTYFTIRSGGRTVITFFFDAVYTWAVPVVLAFVLSRYTKLPVEQIYFCVQFIDILKAVIGLLMLRSDFWARNVVNNVSEQKAG